MKKVTRKEYLKGYFKQNQEYLNNMKPELFNEKPLDELLSKFILPEKQGSKYQERFKAA